MMSNVYSQNIDSIYTYEQLNDYLAEARTSNNYNDLANTYYLMGQYEEINFSRSDLSFQYYINAKQYYDLNHDTLMSKTVDVSIANRYNNTGLYQEAIDLYEKSLVYFTEKGDLNTVAKINYGLGNVYGEKGDNEKRIAYLNKVITINENLKDTLLSVKILNEKVISYELLNELDSALLIAKEIYDISKNAEYNDGKSLGLYQTGRLHKLKSNYSKSLRFLKESENYINNTSYNKQKRNLYKLLSEAYYNVNDFGKAYDYREKYAILSDSILTKEKIQSSNNLALKYQVSEKNNNIKLLEFEKDIAQSKNIQQRRSLYILTIGLILLLASLYFIINFYRQKMESESIINKQNEEINEQKFRELEDNVKINSMHSMLEGQEIERERIARDLHDSLGGLLSAIKLQFDMVKTKAEVLDDVKEYHSANDMLDTAVSEVRSISQNLQPGSLAKLGLVAALKDLFNRFDGDAYPDIDFQYYDIPDKLVNIVALSIYRIIQELLHNAIKHAGSSEILIQINREGDELIVQFEDDGKGYDPENLKRKGMGLENINSRILFLKGEISIDSKPNEGTSVIIRVRYK